MRTIIRRKVTTTKYYEAEYRKFNETCYVCFMATSMYHARPRARTIVNNLGADKLVDVVELDQNNLGQSLHWSKRGKEVPKRRRSKRG